MKIAIFLPNWIGDAVMATPTLRAVRSRFPRAEIVGILRPYVADVLEGLSLVDRLLFFDPRGRDPQQRGRQIVRRLKSEEFDLAVLLPNSLRTAWLAWRSGAKRRVGFARDGRGWLLTDRLKPKSLKQPNPVIDEYLRLAEHLGCRNLTRKMELAVSPLAEGRLKHFWAKHSPLLNGMGIVALNPGGAFGSAKHWPTEYFSELARRIAVEQSRTVLVLCGPAEREAARAIRRHAKHSNVVDLADEQPSIGLTKAAIRSSELLVTTDSGPRHFAPPFDIPVITLFGPTHIAWSETFVSNAVHLQHEVDCGPCQQRTCPLGHHRCMRELTVERVYGEVAKVLGEESARKAG